MAMSKALLLYGLIALLSLDLAAEKPELRFREDGTFKILQLTDMHIRSFNKEQADEVYERIKYSAKTEKPDLIVLTGDNVTVNPAAPEIRRLVSVLDSCRIPWVATFGNHDGQQELTKAQMSSIYASGKYTLNTLNDKGELADLQIEILSSKGKKKAFYIFCMDSHSYTDVLGKECYDWFTKEQVEWLRQCCLKRTSADGKVAPSLAFFHIPLSEYVDASEQNANPREGGNPRGVFNGIRGESVCCGGLNTGMFAAMRETGSVIGVSVGHDHDNDFISIYSGIALCYGRFSGSNTVYNHLPQGVRVFQLDEKERGFETWIREDEDRIVRHVKFNGETINTAPRDRRQPYGVWHEMK